MASNDDKPKGVGGHWKSVYVPSKGYQVRVWEEAHDRSASAPSAPEPPSGERSP